ncbi:efflux RND transporter periplasmic adaptor subunit [Litoribacter populi]|uniref:efflux RND transporter periplasmic adaptor subunit n=1 Tax=Litoribacter populi TaxID=2598460 RepID=UPI00117FB90C|nr:efflux RND transporter periplasmic adaptor subunit [Litoribacter populi]
MNKSFGLASILLTSLMFFACEQEDDSQKEQPLDSFRQEVSATQVRVAQSEKRTFDYLINASGKVEAENQLKVVVERNGYLTELLVKEGETVSQGQIIARLDNSDSKFKLEKALIQKRVAEADFDDRKMGFGKILSGQDTSVNVDEFTDKLRANSGILAAELEVREAELELEKSVIKAPISGKIADLAIKKGTLVNSGDELCELISADQLTLKVKVLEADIGFVSANQKVEVYPVSGKDTQISGTVKSINPKVDENGLVQVSIALAPNSKLLPGMNARAVIRAPQNNSIVVPKDALVYRSGRPVVFTLENGSKESKWNYVEVGKDNGREVEILKGIDPNMTVITTNNLQLAHQAPVMIVEE